LHWGEKREVDKKKKNKIEKVEGKKVINRVFSVGILTTSKT